MTKERLLKKIIFGLMTFLLFSPLSHADKSKTLCSEDDNTCTFVLLNGTNNQLTVINKVRAEQPLSPFSTFKIPNSIIGLETGLIKDEKQTLTFNKEKYPPQKWWPAPWKMPSYNLSTAYKFSMVAIYRQLATDIGQENMAQFLKRFDYGNQDISSGLDNFWLNASMKTSAIDQVTFLQKFYQNKFSLKANTLAIMKEVMLANRDENYKIYAKTGAGKVEDGTMLGWYVGIVEKANEIYYFALNFNRPTYGEMKKLRVEMAMNHLKAAGVID